MYTSLCCITSTPPPTVLQQRNTSPYPRTMNRKVQHTRSKHARLLAPTTSLHAQGMCGVGVCTDVFNLFLAQAAVPTCLKSIYCSSTERLPPHAWMTTVRQNSHLLLWSGPLIERPWLWTNFSTTAAGEQRMYYAQCCTLCSHTYNTNTYTQILFADHPGKWTLPLPLQVDHGLLTTDISSLGQSSPPPLPSHSAPVYHRAVYWAHSFTSSLPLTAGLCMTLNSSPEKYPGQLEETISHLCSEKHQ